MNFKKKYFNFKIIIQHIIIVDMLYNITQPTYLYNKLNMGGIIIVDMLYNITQPIFI